MKRSLAWLAGIVGIAALGRMLSKRRAAPTPGQRPAPADTAAAVAVDPVADPAEELRRKLAAKRQPETTETETETEETETGETETLEERRARVHAKAREAIDAMSDDEAVE